VSTPSHAGAHPGDMKLGTVESNEPYSHLDARDEGILEERRDRGPTERRLEGKVQAFRDRSLQQTPSLLPGLGVGLGQRDPGVDRQDPPGGVVRVVVAGACPLEHGTGDAAFPGSVGPGEHVNTGDPWSIRHACALPSPQPSPILLGRR